MAERVRGIGGNHEVVLHTQPKYIAECQNAVKGNNGLECGNMFTSNDKRDAVKQWRDYCKAHCADRR